MAAWLAHHRGLLTFVLLATFVAGLAVWWERRPPARELVVAAPAEQAGDRQRLITVDVVGAVGQPGIYTLPEGARLADAISAAGGPAADADLSRVNRATKLRDEQQVRVPFLAPTPTVPTAETGAAPRTAPAQPTLIGPLDVNTASLAQLDTLPGIGPVTAQRIILYREQNGPFTHVEQLKEAKLVNAGTFEQIKSLITVE